MRQEPQISIINTETLDKSARQTADSVNTYQMSNYMNTHLVFYISHISYISF